jgi:hypothetical protein
MARLIREEARLLGSRYESIAGITKPEQLFSASNNDFFEIFRYYVTALVSDRHHSDIQRFITAWPARYDPVLDRFVKGLPRCLV